MKTKLDRPKRNAPTQAADARREAKAREVGTRQTETREAVPQERTEFALAIEQSEQPMERLLSPLTSDASAVFALIERVAVDPRADVEKLDRVMAMYERLKAKEAELAYNAAKGQIIKKLACIKIVKNRPALYKFERGNPQKGTYEAFKYAPLEEIDKHLRPLLVQEEMDLSYSDEPREDGGILVRGRLKHLPSGHFEDSFMPAPPDRTAGKSNVQAVGSTNSFLRRYVACNIFNIVVVGDDDDGSGGTIDESQTKTILDLIKKAKVGPKFLKYMKAPSVEEAGSLEAAVTTIAARDYRKAVSTLEQQIAKTEIDANIS